MAAVAGLANGALLTVDYVPVFADQPAVPVMLHGCLSVSMADGRCHSPQRAVHSTYQEGKPSSASPDGEHSLKQISRRCRRWCTDLRNCLVCFS